MGATQCHIAHCAKTAVTRAPSAAVQRFGPRAVSIPLFIVTLTDAPRLDAPTVEDLLFHSRQPINHMRRPPTRLIQPLLPAAGNWFTL